jgi:hypothetical protein
MTQVSVDTVLEAWNQAVPIWNVVGLPALLVVVTVVRGRAGADRRGIVRRIGLIEYALALGWLIRIVSEVWAARSQGLAQANLPILIAGLVSGLIHASLGFGLRRFWKSARWLTIAWTLLTWALTILWTVLVTPSATFDPTEWPRFFLPLLLPAFVLWTLVLPATGRVFTNRDDDRPSVALALGARWFKVVVASGLVVDTLDWAVRAVVEVTD